MNDEQRQEWYKIEERATFLIRQGQALAHTEAFPLFQVVVLPSFEPIVSWEVCEKWEDGETKSYLVVRSIWRIDLDRVQMEQREAILPIKRKYLPPIEPTIEVLATPLPEVWCQTMLSKLQQITIPIYNDGVFRDENGQQWGILDGTSYEIAFEPGHISARFHWAEEPPTQWQPLHAFVQEVLKELDRP
ncbi:MAG TPA: hypothetical protein VF600_00160 [Abditibacteriaceae bacterium]|jgi:hypothetical protein